MQSEQTLRFIYIFKQLIENEIVKSAADFGRTLGLNNPAQSMNNILKGKREVSKDMLRSLYNVYNVNPSFIEKGVKPLFLDVNQKKDTATLESPNILFVPERAAAGYSIGFSDPEYFETLPSGRIPGFEGRYYQGFPVIGDSMYDTLHPGDWVICSKVNELQNIINNEVYVIVTDEGIVVKRVQNRVNVNNEIIMISDNKNFYPQYSITPDKVQQVWKVEARISKYLASPTNYEKRLSELENQINTLNRK